MRNFRSVYAYATTGGDEAYLTDSGAGDTFTGTAATDTTSLTDGSTYTIRTNQFPKVIVTSKGGNAVANLTDTAGNDNFWGDLTDAVLSDGTLDPTTGNLTGSRQLLLPALPAI